MEIANSIPQELVNFLLVVVFSLLIGLEQRRLHIDIEFETLFGTDRTITLIGILGFILYYIMPDSMVLFYGGGVILSALLGVYYHNKIRISNRWGFTSIVIALITYCLTPLVVRQPHWLVLLVVVSILVIVELKESLLNFSKKFDRNEFTLLAKFITIAGIVLPLLPNQPLSQYINISPYQVWVSIVAVSGISYLSYLLRKFAFPNSGIILSAILGGLYSSTATTIILARKSNTEDDKSHIVAGIFGATCMMYLRILLLAAIFNYKVALLLLPYFVALAIVSAGTSFFMRYHLNGDNERHNISSDSSNPLEFKTALVFGLLFAFFAVITTYVLNNYGYIGMNILSFIVGVTDIDPYILNLFQNTSANLQVEAVAKATIIATASNNLIKMIYATILGKAEIRKVIVLGFAVIIGASIIAILVS